jgi:hypothetical protein
MTADLNGRDLFWCYTLNEPFLLRSLDDWKNWYLPGTVKQTGRPIRPGWRTGHCTGTCSMCRSLANGTVPQPPGDTGMRGVERLHWTCLNLRRLHWTCLNLRRLG